MRKLPIFLSNKNIKNLGFRNKFEYADNIRKKKNVKLVNILRDGVEIIPKYTRKEYYKRDWLK